MKRDARLAGMSSDHHQALVLARRLGDAALAGKVTFATVKDLRRAYDADLAPHFAIEERLLLPALRKAGETALVQRTLRDHSQLREHLAAAELGHLDRVAAFATLLTDHVRFEERDLFGACEGRLPASVLDEVRAQRPDPSTQRRAAAT